MFVVYRVWAVVLMRKLRFIVSLMTNDNDYQMEQARSADLVAQKSSVDHEILYAENDAITQSTQILKSVQAAPEERPDAIVFEPVGGTALPQVARAAVEAGIGWAVLNRDVNYVSELRKTSKVPVFGLTHDQLEVGRLQARQCAAMLPSGGTVLYIQGPSENPVAKERFYGMEDAKPTNIHLIVLKGQWTEDSAQRAVRSWLKLTTSHKTVVDAIVAQNDVMAMGARKAFQEMPSEDERERWLQLPFIGVDGVAKTGQAWIRSGLLAATVFTPPNAGQAMELMIDALRNLKTPAERILITPVSMPPVDALRSRK